MTLIPRPASAGLRGASFRTNYENTRRNYEKARPFVKNSAITKGQKLSLILSIFLIRKRFFDKKAIIQLKGYQILVLCKTLDL
jgi:hypothetical protein